MSDLEKNVIVVAATNRPDVLDSAILRPGRLDRLLFVPPPNIHDRIDILRVLTKKYFFLICFFMLCFLHYYYFFNSLEI